MALHSFTKLFSSLTESTLWIEQPNHVRIVWITMLAMADSDGLVAASVPGLAHRARVSVAECEEALQVFLSPDKYSRTTDHEGRRIRAVGGGWELLNHAKYRKLLSSEAERERKAEWARRKREEDLHSRLQKTEVAENRQSSSDSSSVSDSGSSDPDQEGVQGEPAPLNYPGPLRPSKRELHSEPVGQPTLRHKFRKSWKPNKDHRMRGQELGLTEDEILDRAEDCRRKVHKQGFDNEDDHFMRELAWEARDKQERKFKQEAYANRRDFEQPGHDRT